MISRNGLLHSCLSFLAVCLLAASGLNAAELLHIRVAEGDGQVYATGSRATRGLTVQVTDETGKPVGGATVSFLLPEDGPGGAFSGGLHTSLTTTKPDGTATAWGMQWNRLPGPFEIRITAAKGTARAGIVSTQYLSDKVGAPKAGGTGSFQASHHSRNKWLLIGLAIGGAAAGGMAIEAARGSHTTAAVATPPPSIGVPTITIGHP